MKKTVSVLVQIDPSCDSPDVIIRTNKRTALVENIVRAVEQCVQEEAPYVTAYQGDAAHRIRQQDILRVHTEPRKVIVRTASGLYEARCPLRELEEALDADRFQRISRFEIVNISRIASFDFSVSGTIKVIFDDGSSTWVARRYVRAIQQALNRTKGAKEGEQ